MVAKSGDKNATELTTTQRPDRPKIVKVLVKNSEAVIENGATCSTNGTSGKSDQGSGTLKRFYIDELGFYRYLDADEHQYVCSNVNFIERKTSLSSLLTVNVNGKERRKISAAGGGESAGIEVCFKTLRHDLGISHFDKTEEYESWKSGWDEFMRIKLISQQPVTLNRELKSRVRSGIPHDYRCKVWTALIRMRTRNIRTQFGDDIYEVIIRDLVSKFSIPDYGDTGADRNNNTNHIRSDRNRANKSNSNTTRPKSQAAVASRENGRSSYLAPINGNSHPKTLSDVTNRQTSQTPLAPYDQQLEKCFKQIELDLLRTLPNNRHFEDPNSIGIQRVRRVLRAYACFNQAVGYCQGMNRLAAMALLVLPEEEAFWCLVAIIQCIMPKDYYLKPWLAQVDCCVLGDLLEKKMPKLHKHLVKNDIQLTLFTWFFTIFVDGFRPELMLRIWDCFLLEGDKVLFRFALAILYICQDDLLKMNDFSTMSSHLSRLVSTRRLDVEQLFETFNMMNPLATGTLESKREFHRNKIRSILEE